MLKLQKAARELAARVVHPSAGYLQLEQVAEDLHRKSNANYSLNNRMQRPLWFPNPTIILICQQ
jgi:hypothetical protein